jgi:FkbM family methyltransferase
MLGELVSRLLGRFGYSLQRLPQDWLPGRTYWDTAYLQRLGFNPATLVDVGVAYGTPNRECHSLYEAFPHARLVLMEPLREFDPHVESILARHPGIHVRAAAGAREGRLGIDLHPLWLERSSLYQRHSIEEAGEIKERRQVPVTTLDHVMAEHELKGPFGIKIDAEGCEIDVLEGAEKMLGDTQFVIAEVAVTNRFRDGYTFADFVAYMDRHGFELCDLLDIGRAENSIVTFVDGVFRKRV